MWLAEHSSGKRRSGLAVVGTHLAYDADATALAIVSADGEGRYIDTSALDSRRRGGAGVLACRPRSAQGAARSQAGDARPGRAGLDAGTASPPIPRWRPTWCGPGSAASPSTTCRCATCAASCARKPLSSNSFRCSTTPRASDDQAVQTLILRAVAVLDLADALDEELARINSTVAVGRHGAAGAAGAGGHGTRRHRSRSASCSASCKAISPTRSATRPKRPTR